MKRAALIDDDPVELAILCGVAESLDESWVFTRFHSVDDFVSSDMAASFDVLFLDRRVPPHHSFEETVSIIENSDFSGHVVLLTNHRTGSKPPKSTISLLGPYEKIDIQEPDVLEKLLSGQPIL